MERDKYDILISVNIALMYNCNRVTKLSKILFWSQ